jgi:hypothetical protein
MFIQSSPKTQQRYVTCTCISLTWNNSTLKRSPDLINLHHTRSGTECMQRPAQISMKCIFIQYLTFMIIAICQVGTVPQESSSFVDTIGSVHNIPPKLLYYSSSPAIGGDTPPLESPPGSPLSWEDEIWQKAYCRGAKLLAAMSASEEKQRNILQWPYIGSKWDGDLHKELEEWGYRDSDELHRNADIFCDFSGSFHELSTAFKAMGINPRSAELGGPNHCFHVEHQNGPAVLKKPDGSMPDLKDQRYNVDGKEYRVSDSINSLC